MPDKSALYLNVCCWYESSGILHGGKCIESSRSETRMRVELEVPESVREPRSWVEHEQILGMALRPGSIEVG
jgi:hypothetical protein